MKIATWNVNGVRARLESLLMWLKAASPDILCLQETKTQDEEFPYSPIEELGYNLVTAGQKGFNGVAIASKFAVKEVISCLPGMPDDAQARYIEALISLNQDTEMIRIASLYAPNGNPIDSDKFTYKLDWMKALEGRLKYCLSLEGLSVMAGDYNVIPEPLDAKDPESWVHDALYQPSTRASFRRLVHLGYTDAIRSVTGDQVFTFWNYRTGAWNKNNGIRIDHALLSPSATDRLVSAGIDKEVRGWNRPSDHVPVWLELDIRSRQRGTGMEQAI